MQYDRTKALSWLKGAAVSFPNIDQIINSSPSDTFVIGAGVFDIYHGQDWLPTFKRKTGDLDLSIGLVNNIDGYEIAKEGFIRSGYIQSDPERKYRFFPPKKLPGALAYVDLLAHPITKNVSDTVARGVMGVGPGFSFAAVGFAMLGAYKIDKNIHFPNPLALAALKLRAYQDEPLRRVKDLADVAEMVWGLVEKGIHFEIGDLWTKVKNHKEAEFVRGVLGSLGRGESAQWDLDAARFELERRNFSVTDIEEVIPERLIALFENLPV